MAQDASPKKQPTVLPVITSKTDSRDLLAKARQQALQRGLDKYFIVDVDAHIGEGACWPDVLKYIENPATREAAFSFGDGYFNSLA